MNERPIPYLRAADHARRESAYLCMRYTVIAGCPVLRGVGIYSAGVGGLATMGEDFYAEVWRIDAADYDTAQREMRAWIATNPRMAWARQFIEPERLGPGVATG